MTARHVGAAIEVTDVIASFCTVREHPERDGQVRFVLSTGIDDESGAIGVVIDVPDLQEARQLIRMFGMGLETIDWNRRQKVHEEETGEPALPERREHQGAPDANVVSLVAKLADATARQVRDRLEEEGS